MRIKTNFSTSSAATAPRIMVVLWVTALLAMLLATWMAMQTSQMKQAKIDLEHELSELKNRHVAGMPKEFPSQKELATLKNRISAVSSISSGGESSLSAFLRKIELLLPDEAYLVTLHYKGDTSEAQITAEASSAKILTVFLRDLEKEKSFNEVFLTKQSQRTLNDKQIVQFDLRIKERLS
ncbi:MAG: PilN domain-containing protein [Gammaproteobacteria bacterium]